MLQLLMFGALAFTMLILSGFYPAEQRAVNLDTDWLLRLPGRAFIRFCQRPLQSFGNAFENFIGATAAVFRRSSTGSVKIEKRLDWVFHTVLVAVPDWVLRGVRTLQTEKTELSWNLLFILIPFVFLLLAVLITAL
jgi:hypothetical protein